MLQLSLPEHEVFYAERDNRTNLNLPQPAEPVKIAITISPGWVNSVDGQLTLYWLASLVSRMGRRFNQLQIWLPPGISHIPCLIPGVTAPHFFAAIGAHLREADPYGSYRAVELPTEGSFVISIGDMAGATPGLIVRPNGWSAAVAEAGTLSSSKAPSLSNPIGAALAASLGAAEIYRHFNQSNLPGYPARFPLWVSALRSAVTYSPEEAASWSDEPLVPDVINFGRCMVVGAGALGGNALVILGAFPGLQGHFDVVDPDKVEYSNLNRMVEALKDHKGTFKADLAVASLCGTSATAIAHNDTYERLQSSGGTSLPVESYDLVLTGVDQMVTRAFVQSGWPRYLINAGTRGFAWSVSTHPIEKQSACIGCLAGKSQHSYMDLQAPLGCAIGLPTQPIKVPVMDSFGFVSFFGATFLAARALQHSLKFAPPLSQGISTQAVALNLTGIQHREEQPSELCLCRCSHPVVQQYRENKYAEGTR